MRSFPGFLYTLQSQLESISPQIIDRINRPGGLDLHDLISLVLNPKDSTVDCPELVDASEITHYEEVSDAAKIAGDSLVDEGKVAFCILAGGAGTRIGAPKCFLDIPASEDTLLTKKIKQASNLKDVWVITSPELSLRVKQHIKERGLERKGLEIVEQYESLRLTADNQVYLNSLGEPSLYPCGHGDVVPALTNSGLIEKFLQRQGKHVYVTNVDNYAGCPDSRIFGMHDLNNNFITCEVIKKKTGDRGGVLCKHLGVNQIVETFRMSLETDVDQFKFLNTNSMIFRADLPFDKIKWTWHRVKKIVDNQVVVQYERLLQQLTEVYKTQFVEVDRSRFFPVKNADDLQNIVNL